MTYELPKNCGDLSCSTASPCHFQCPGHISSWCVFATPSKFHSPITLEPKGRGLMDTHKDMSISKARSEPGFLPPAHDCPWCPTWGLAALHFCDKNSSEWGLLSRCQRRLTPPSCLWIQGYPGHQESRVNTEGQIEFSSHMN